VSLSKPVVAVAGSPAWAGTVETLLRQAHFGLVHCNDCADPARLAGRLVDDFPALLLMDGDDPHWWLWIEAIKTDQATRRLPILVVAHDDSVGQDALAAGAKGFIQVDELGEHVVPAIRAHARIPTQAVIDELLCQCGEELPPLAQLGVQRFNAGDYLAQHDAFKKQWMAENGPVRDLYRAILQVGVAYYHITQGNAVGALKVLRRSVRWFAMLPDICQGVDVRQLRQDADRVYAALQAIEPADITSFDLALLRPIQLIAG
jgi:predicted metal-dependent hydrolase